jgi:hypothetical protein
MMIKLDLLDALSDSELGQIEAYFRALKKCRDEKCRSKAIDEARAILAAAGIDVRDLASTGKKDRKALKLRRAKTNCA